MHHQLSTLQIPYDELTSQGQVITHIMNLLIQLTNKQNHVEC